MDIQQIREKPHWSFSSINQFLNVCSLQWFFRYIERLEPEHTSSALLFGKAFHAAADWLARQRQRGNDPAVQDIEDVFSEAWLVETRFCDNILYKDKEDENSLDKQGRAMVACLAENWDPTETVLAAGKAFCVPLEDNDGRRISDKPLIGEFDCVVLNAANRRTIIDWKTGARKWPEGKADKDLQATAYAYADGKEPGGERLRRQVRYDLVTKTASPVFVQYITTRDEARFARFIHMVQCIQRAIDAEVFLPNEQGYFCGSCEYATACREWHRCSRSSWSVAA